MINRENFSTVKKYLAFQADVMQRGKGTVHYHETCLRNLLQWLDDRPLTDAPDIRPAYPLYLLSVRYRRTGAPPSAHFVRGMCEAARAFFTWLIQSAPKRYPTITAAWVMTLRPPRLPNEPRKEHQAVTLDMVRQLIALPEGNLALWRDKAAAAFLFLSGCRATAFTTLTLDCVDIAARTVKQLPTMGVKTKNSKAAITTLLPIPDLLDFVRGWDDYLRSRYPGSTLWYPATKPPFYNEIVTDGKIGEQRGFQVRIGLRKLFTLAGLPPMSPHKFRHGNAVYGLKLAKDISELKAVSMNLMHASIGITDSIYAVLSDKDLAKQIAQLGQGQSEPTTQDNAAQSEPDARPFTEAEIAAAVEFLRAAKEAQGHDKP